MDKVVEGFIYVDKIDEGWIAVIVDEKERVVAVSLPKKSEEEAVIEAKRAAKAPINYGFRSDMIPLLKRVGKEVVEFIVRSLRGERADFKFKLNAHGTSNFMRGVLSITSSIPKGFVTSYGCVAKILGRPNAGRAVGNALAENPWPILIPCHRVVRSDLNIGGYRGGREFKKLLLRAEGVSVTRMGKVLSKHFLSTEEVRHYVASRREKLNFFNLE